MLKNPFKKNLLVNKYQKLITEINSLENNLKLLNDEELRVKNLNLQKRYKKTESLNSLLVESFALTREASFRTLGLRHFDVQLLGGIILNRGKIAEMRTGEGKTLVATLPASLNALTKKGVHVVTVNDYLANRDQVSMGQIYRFLGLDTGLIQQGMTPFERWRNYNADITYVTNYEIVFDYLRDNMTKNLKNVVLRPFNYSIVDEVDSILIDEAQTPLIMADPVETLDNKYVITAEITKYLEVNVDFKIDEKNKNIILTQHGTEQIEKILKVQDLYNLNDPWIPYIMNSIKANALYFNNIHYIIQNNRIIIVDEFTGRIMPDRRWGEGLHQAIEAKENLPIRESTETLASITYQNFFLAYPKLSGMTGTGKTAEIEFEKIYKLSVERIPTARPNIRKDLPDFIYKDQFSKWNAIAQECDKISSQGQPILIGTTTVEKSEMLAQLLKEYKLSYQILNAKPENVRKESEIIAQAGKETSITIATNMAGRGTDIILGGNIEFRVQKELYTILTLVKNLSKKQKIANLFKLFPKIKINNCSQKAISVLLSVTNDSQFLSLSDVDILRALRENDRLSIMLISYQCSVKFLVNELIGFNKKRQQQNQKIVKNLGGLYVIGTERNDSQRIDNQLRGRCARQGDPGTSRFFLSLDDRLLRLFGGPKVQKFMQSQLSDDSPLESKFITKSLDRAQNSVEERAYEQRKNLFEYDDVLNKQRQTIYYERRKILESQSIRNKVLQYGEQAITENMKKLKPKKSLNAFSNVMSRLLYLFLYGKNFRFLKIYANNTRIKKLKSHLFSEIWIDYYMKSFDFDSHEESLFEKNERRNLLILNDFIWKEHLQKMALLRDAVGWRGYGQKNPLYEYKEDAYFLFQDFQVKLRQLVLHNLKRSSIL